MSSNSTNCRGYVMEHRTATEDPTNSGGNSNARRHHLTLKEFHWNVETFGVVTNFSEPDDYLAFHLESESLPSIPISFPPFPGNPPSSCGLQLKLIPGNNRALPGPFTVYGLKIDFGPAAILTAEKNRKVEIYSTILLLVQKRFLTFKTSPSAGSLTDIISLLFSAGAVRWAGTSHCSVVVVSSCGHRRVSHLPAPDLSADLNCSQKELTNFIKVHLVQQFLRSIVCCSELICLQSSSQEELVNVIKVQNIDPPMPTATVCCLELISSAEFSLREKIKVQGSEHCPASNDYGIACCFG
ncbi:hypothetical protein J6590_031369 [Homalodisca vitripennis]|nr:hypothetical protein J6590_031369 [Homalodisca vitripennis]